ncbi:MAG: hypothetical protein HUJ31_17325 [Pseudomonadales bacterium]|nr:hypothetical protein [Pseudomonadales bacterium]
MKFKLAGIGIVMVGLMSLGLSDVASAQAPVAKLVQVEGEVEYSRNGDRWRPVRRTKYLFPGYTIRTGEDGSGKLINQETGKSQELGPDSRIEIEETDIKVVSGSLTSPKEEEVSFFQGLLNKFARAQRYTTVRRSIDSGDDQCDNKVRTVREVTLSPSYPDLVWRNACPEYSYRLVIDGKKIEVPAQANAEMIRYTITDVKPGKHSYHVEVLDKDGTIYIPRRESSFTWLSEDQEEEILAGLDQFQQDVFMETNYLEEKNMWVAAMDKYRDFFQEYPDENEMRPLLIQSYQELKLSNLRENEARLYQAKLEEDF